MNAGPLFFYQEGFMPFPSLGEAEAYLGEKIFIPRYFPPNLSWPPSQILAQRKPFLAYVVKFQKKGEGGISLVLTVASGRHPLSGFQIVPVRTLQSIRVKIAGQSAELSVGRLRSGERCSLISWVLYGRRRTLSGLLPPAEILRMAETMEEAR